MNVNRWLMVGCLVAAWGWGRTLPVLGMTNTVPFDDDFETYPEGVSLSGGTNGWFASSDACVVSTNFVYTGDFSALVPTDTTLSNRFEPLSTNVWVELMLWALPYDGVSNPVANTNVAMFYYLNTSGYFVVYNGSETNWQTISNGVSPVSTMSWIQVDMHLDYKAHRWDLYASTQLITNNIGFAQTNLNQFQGFDLYSGGNTTYLDSVWVFTNVGVAQEVTVSTNSASAITVTWSAVARCGYYSVWRCPSNVPASATNVGVVTNLHFFLDTNVSSGVTYFYWVKADNRMCTGDFSEAQSGFRLFSAPTNVAASRGLYANQVALTWDGVAGASNYTIYRNNSGVNASNTAVVVGGTNGAGTSWNDTNAVSGSNYYYWVTASNAECGGVFGAGVMGHSIWQFDPVSNVTASVNTYGNKVQVSWDAASGLSPILYSVYRDSVDSTSSATFLGITNATAFSDVTVPAGSNHYYWVKAANILNTSDFSVVSALGVRCFSPPSGVSASQSLTNEIRITWSGVGMEGATNYIVYRSQVNATNTAVEWAQTNTIFFDDWAVLVGTGYWYWVKSANDISTSALSQGAMGVIDNTPPTPNPMTFSNAPVGASPTSIWMRAATAVDPNLPVQYLFTNLTQGASSGWTTNPVWTNVALGVNERHQYQVKARDALGNQTTGSTALAAYSLALTPQAPEIVMVSPWSVRVRVHAGLTGGIYYADGNPTNTRYALTFATNGTVYYLTTNGALDVDPEWASFSTWGGTNGVTVSNLDYRATNLFAALAQNSDFMSTPAGTSALALFLPLAVEASVTQTNSGTGALLFDTLFYSPWTNLCQMTVWYGYAGHAQTSATHAVILDSEVSAQYGAPIVLNGDSNQIRSVSTVYHNNRLHFSWLTQSAGHALPLTGLDTNVWVAFTVNDTRTHISGLTYYANVRIDNACPTLALTSTLPDPTRYSPIPVTATFVEDVTGFTASDVGVANGVVSNFVAVNASTYTFDVIPADQGAVTVSIVSNVAHDVFGNPNQAASPLIRTYDIRSPSVMISSAEHNPTKTTPIPVTATFSKDVAGFSTSALWVGNGLVSGFTALSASVYRFNVTPSDPGAVTVDIPANVALDAAGNGNLAAEQFSITYDSTAPTAILTSLADDVTGVVPIPAVVTFSKVVTGFAASGLAVSNAVVTNFTAVSPTRYTFGLMPQHFGWVWAEVPSNAAQDSAGNGNTTSLRLSRQCVLAAPLAVTASAGDYSDKVRITWKAAFGATQYRVYRNSVNSLSGATEIGIVSASAYDDTSAAVQVTCYYWVKSENVVGLSDASPSTSGYRQLPPPASLSATTSQVDAVNLAWSSVGVATGYEVWRGATAGSLAKLAVTASLFYNDLVATPGVPLVYAVKSVNATATSDWSDRVTGQRRRLSDHRGEGPANLAVYQSASGLWLIRSTATGSSSFVGLGGPGYLPVAADYDGDGHTDWAVYHATSGQWWVLLSASGYAMASTVFGGAGYVPAPGDYDVDNKADPAVYEGASGRWLALLSSGGYAQVAWVTTSGAVPATGDYDGDSRIDPTVYAAAQAQWVALLSLSGYQSVGLFFGGASYLPVPADYDGDGKTDPAVYFQNVGGWYVMLSSAGYAFFAVSYGGIGFVPMPADYDSDGKVDLAVYQESTGLWLVRLSGSQNASVSVFFGGPGYTPVGAVR